MPSSHLILCHPLFLLPPLPPSIRVFSNESTLSMRWPKYWSFSLSIIPSNEHPGLIFRMDWLYLLAVQGALKSLLQHYSSKASILWHSAFFTVQLSHPYITTGKTTGNCKLKPQLSVTIYPPEWLKLTIKDCQCQVGKNVGLWVFKYTAAGSCSVLSKKKLNKWLNL